MKKWILPLIMIIGVYVAFSGEFFVQNKGEALFFISGIINPALEIEELREKNKALEIEILNLRVNNPNIGQTITNGGISAKVFSAYPFADRSKLTVNAGSLQGIEIGDAVIIDNSLVGRVKAVYKRTSVVQTIFDSEFKIPVRIGTSELNALYTGGINPRLNMISAGDIPQYGELVLSVSPDLPYGLGLGQILQVVEGPLQEASIRPLFEIKEIRNVFIITD